MPKRLDFLPTAFCALRNFRTPLRILDRVFFDDVDLKYLDVPGFPPILFVRDPDLIRRIAVETANGGDFDRDTLPTQGIGRVVGKQNLLYAQGEIWQRHKAAAVRPLGTRAVQTPEVFHNLERNIKRVVEPHLIALANRVRQSPTGLCRMRLEPDIQRVMLALIVNVLFGAGVLEEELETRYLPAISRVIRYILVDTVANQFGIRPFDLPAFTPGLARLQRDRATFEELVDRAIRTRDSGSGFWPLLTAAGPEEAVRSNVRVFLAGALEATSSYISWALVHLARNSAAQSEARAEALGHAELSPEARENAIYLKQVLNESLRLNNALYFLPRVALRDTTVSSPRGTLAIPANTHLVLATYHANRCERFWGKSATGHPATAFVPERWDAANMAAHGRSTSDNLHFGFGHGPRVCVGKHFSEAEAFVCLTLFLRRFEIRADGPTPAADSGISTRPRDGVDVEIRIREG